MKLISAVLVVLALVLPQWRIFRRLPNPSRFRRALASNGSGA